MKKNTLLMLGIMFFFASSMHAGTIYLVDNTATSGPGGTGWRAAVANEVNVHLGSQSFNDWYASITFATNTDQVWLLSDIYILTGLVGVKTNGKIYGGFYGTETSISFGSSTGFRRLNTSPAGNWDLKYPSILDGNATYQGMKGGSGSAVVDGLTIQNCKYTGSTTGQAAGVTLNFSTTTMQNCIVTGCINAGSGSGGATSAVSLTATTKMVNSYIHNNTYSGTGGYGGGAVSVIGSTGYAATPTDAISGCKITNNSNTTSNNGGGVFLYSGVVNGLKSLGIKNSIISNNTSGQGGGIYVYIANFNNAANNTPVLISGCTFDSNITTGATYGGGAIYINNSTTSNTNNTFTLQNSTFTNNRAATTAPAATQGSAFYSNANITINNCVVAGNVGGNVFYLGNASGVSASVNNCTFANNVNLTPAACQLLYCSSPPTASTFTNTIIFNQTGSPLNTSTGGVKPTVTYCGFENSVSLANAPYNGTMNINTISASSFVNSGSDYHLVAGSTATDAGTTISACSPDLDNVTRAQGTNYCMGAYELTRSKFFFRSNASGNWSTLNSWQYSPNTIWLSATSAPTSSASSVTIQNVHEITVDANATSPSLVVNSGAKLTLNSGNTLGINGNFTINSDPSLGTGTIVDLNANGGLTVTGTTTVNQSLQAASALRTWYITPPVATATPSPTLTIIKYFDETQNTGNASDNWVSTTSMVAKVGYQVVPVAGNDISFTGTLNNGNQNITLTSRTGTDNYAGFNLIGNPYASYLDWNLVTANTSNAELMRSTTMWYRTKKLNEASQLVYQFWTVNGDGVSSPNGANPKIPPMQAFWVRANAGGGTLALTNDMRSHAPASDLLLKAPAAKKTTNTLVRLQVNNGTNTDEVVLYVSGNASNGLDTYDAPKMSNDNVAIPEIYTTVGTEQMVINAMNSLPLDTPIELAFVPGNATSFSLTANEISNLPTDVKLILKDNVTNVETDLTDGASSYQFSPEVTSPNRFSVIFRSAGSVTNIETTQNNSMIVYSNAPQLLTVICNDKIQAGSMLSVYNAIGQKLLSQQLTGTTTQIAGKFTPGIYIVKVNNSTKKAFIN